MSNDDGTKQRFKDTPESGRVSAGDREKIMHVSLRNNKTKLITKGGK
jgi:hypothetical protein